MSGRNHEIAFHVRAKPKFGPDSHSLRQGAESDSFQIRIALFIANAVFGQSYSFGAAILTGAPRSMAGGALSPAVTSIEAGVVAADWNFGSTSA
jgi:hypothetical protein